MSKISSAPSKLHLERIDVFTNKVGGGVAVNKNFKSVFKNHDFKAFLSFGGNILKHHHHHHGGPLQESLEVVEGCEQCLSNVSTSSSSESVREGNRVPDSAKLGTPLQAAPQLQSSTPTTKRPTAVLSAILSPFSETPSPSFQFKASFEVVPKTKAFAAISNLSPEIQTMYVFLLSQLLLEHSLEKCRRVIPILTTTFGIDGNTHNKLASIANDLVSHFLTELRFRMDKFSHNNGVHKETEFSSPADFKIWKESTTKRISDQLSLALKEPLHKASLSLNVVSGRNLKIKDKASKSSDPYVSLHLVCESDSDKFHQSKSSHPHKTSIKKTELNPVWNEHFDIETVNQEEHYLVATVFDHDLVTKNDFMGTTMIDLKEADRAVLPFDFITKEYPLHPKGSRSLFSKILGKDHHNHHDGEKDLGDLKLSYYYISRDFIKSEDITNVPKDIVSLYNMDHHHDMATLVGFLTKNDTMTIPPEINQLLIQFENRVCISSFTRLTILLEVILENFTINWDNFTSIYQALTQLYNDIHNGKMILTIDMKTKISALLKSLKHLFKKLISRFGLSFPVNIDEKGNIDGISDENGKLLQISISILKLLCNIKSITVEPKNKNVDENLLFNQKIDKYLMMYFEYFFNMIKEKSLIKIETTSEFENIVGLLDIYDAVEVQISNDIDIYSPFFGNGIDLGTKSVRAYYTLLKKETEQIISKEKEVCMETFTLLKKIQKLHDGILSSYEKELKDIKIDLDVMFIPFLRLWVEQARSQFKSWIHRSLEKEKWEAIDQKKKVLHSTSVIDLFSIFEIGKNHLVGLQLEKAVDSVLVDYISVVDEIYNEYLDYVMQAILTDLNEIFHEVVDEACFSKLINLIAKCNTKLNSSTVSNSSSSGKGGTSTGNIPPTSSIKTPLCTKLNCIEFSRQLLDDLSSDMESKFPNSADKISAALTKSFSNSRKKYEYVIDLAIAKLGQWIQVSFDNMLSKLPPIPKKSAHRLEKIIEYDQKVLDQAMEPMITFLTHELSTLSSNLYQTTFGKFIKGVWLTIWVQLERRLFPTSGIQKEGDELLNQKISLFLGIYNSMEDFFNADGDGMTIEQLRSPQVETLAGTISVFYIPTEELIEIQKKMIQISLDGQQKKFDTSILTVKISSSNNTNGAGTTNSLPFQSTVTLQEIHIISALASRSNTDPEARKFVTKTKHDFKNRMINEKFNISSSNTLTLKTKCQSSFGIPTVIYLMSNNICWTSQLSYNETKVAHPWSNITQVFKQNTKEHKDTIHIIIGEQNYDLWGFKSHKISSFFSTLLNIASKFNEKIINNVALETKEDDTLSIDQDHVYLKSLFKLADNDKVYESFSCLKRGVIGKITLTDHYFCYQNHITYSTQKYLWSDIVLVKKEDTFFSTGVVITFDSTDKRKVFNGLNKKRDHLYNNIITLWNKYKSIHSNKLGPN